MKIGIDFRMGGVRHGGIGRYVFELLKAELQLATADKFYIFFNDSQSHEDLALLEQYPHTELVKTQARHYSLAEQVSFLRTLNNCPLDVMHFPNFNHPVRYKEAFVVTIHDMVHHRLGGHKKSHFLHFQGYKWEMAHAARQSRSIIVPSSSARDEVVAFFPESAGKIHVIYEGGSVQPVAEALVAKVKEQFFLDRPYFLFVGTLEHKKNIPGLAKGFSRLLEKFGLDVDLVIAGKPDPHYPEERLRALGAAPAGRLIFTGFVDEDTLAALYQGAYAYVNASVNEGFGLPGVEAMRFGLPLAVSDTKVFNEIYDDAAVYFNPADADDIAEKLRLLATDDKFYETKRVASWRRRVLFDWSETAKKTLEVLYAGSDVPLVQTTPEKQVVPGAATSFFAPAENV